MISYGCYKQCAVSKKFEDEARKKLYEIGGDPSVLDCADIHDVDPFYVDDKGALSCSEGHCTL
jgi:hypothetical protein